MHPTKGCNRSVLDEKDASCDGLTDKVRIGKEKRCMRSIRSQARVSIAKGKIYLRHTRGKEGDIASFKSCANEIASYTCLQAVLEYRFRCTMDTFDRTCHRGVLWIRRWTCGQEPSTYNTATARAMRSVRTTQKFPTGLKGSTRKEFRCSSSLLDAAKGVVRLAERYAPLQVPLVEGFEPEGYVKLGPGNEEIRQNRRNPFVDDADENCFRLIPSVIIEQSDESRFEEYATQALENADSLCGEDDAWVLRTEDNGVKAYTRPIHNTDQVAIKHTVEYDLPADQVMDLYVKLNYTSVVDPYTTSLRSVQAFDTERYEWLQVIHTFDPLAFGVFKTLAPRDYVTLDFVDKEKMMLVSKSVEHPTLPNLSNADDLWIGSKRVFRVPFLYAVKAEEVAASRTRLTIIHWADIGGNIGRPVYTALAIINFGNKFANSFRSVLEQVEEEILSGSILLGNKSSSFLADPLEGGWVKDPQLIFKKLREKSGKEHAQEEEKLLR